jgi:hypothetical protein
MMMGAAARRTARARGKQVQGRRRPAAMAARRSRTPPGRRRASRTPSRRRRPGPKKAAARRRLATAGYPGPSRRAWGRRQRGRAGRGVRWASRGRACSRRGRNQPRARPSWVLGYSAATLCLPRAPGLATVPSHPLPTPRLSPRRQPAALRGHQQQRLRPGPHGPRPQQQHCRAHASVGVGGVAADLRAARPAGVAAQLGRRRRPN